MNNIFLILILSFFVMQPSFAFFMTFNSDGTISIQKKYSDDTDYAAFGDRQLDIRTIKLEGQSWDRTGTWNNDDINELFMAFPNIEKFTCIKCGYFSLGELSIFKNLKSISIDMLPTVYGTWRYGEKQLDEINLDGLEYNNIDDIYINASPITNISCQTLGVWSKKIMMHYSGRRNWPDPYKSIGACFPELASISNLIISGDKLYNNKNLDQAHENYKKAFSINPYDQKAISSLALTYYKKMDYCKSAQVAFSGINLENGISSSKASIAYNLYLSLLKLGDVTRAIKALELSNEYSPSDAKLEKLKSLKRSKKIPIDNCSFSNNWVFDLRRNIEKEAVNRSRSDTNYRISFKNFKYTNYETILRLKGGRAEDTTLSTAAINLSTGEILNAYFYPGFYGLIVTLPKSADKKYPRNELELWCNSEYIGENLLREYFVEFDNLDNTKTVKLYQLFKIDKIINNATCYFGGNSWLVDSNIHKVDIVKFTMPTSNMPNK